MSGTIKAIDKTSVHRITSGQVVVDLQTAVKELLENSMDAGATNIEIRFKQYGLKSLEIVDNGSGIAEEDFESIALKHHTSKLEVFSDLSSVSTFGFRGEALSSLCALSESVSVTTATAETSPMGVCLEMDASGRVKSRSTVARQQGTTVTITNLFTPLPVRRKEFDRNAKREFGKALGLLTAYALGPCSSPCTSGMDKGGRGSGVRLSVSNQLEKGPKSQQIKTLGDPNTRAGVSALWGPKALENVVDLELGFEMEKEKGRRIASNVASASTSTSIPVKVKGLISKFAPGCGRTGSDRQFFYVNGRPCDMKKVQKTFNETYKTFNTNQFPFIIADFILPTDAYDVNVSPDKRTIMIHQEAGLVAGLKEALEAQYSHSRATFDLSGTQRGKGQTQTQTLITQSINIASASSQSQARTRSSGHTPAASPSVNSKADGERQDQTQRSGQSGSSSPLLASRLSKVQARSSSANGRASSSSRLASSSSPLFLADGDDDDDDGQEQSEKEEKDEREEEGERDEGAEEEEKRLPSSMFARPLTTPRRSSAVAGSSSKAQEKKTIELLSDDDEDGMDLDGASKVSHGHGQDVQADVGEDEEQVEVVHKEVITSNDKVHANKQQKPDSEEQNTTLVLDASQTRWGRRIGLGLGSHSLPTPLLPSSPVPSETAAQSIESVAQTIAHSDKEQEHEDDEEDDLLKSQPPRKKRRSDVSDVEVEALVRDAEPDDDVEDAPPSPALSPTSAKALAWAREGVMQDEGLGPASGSRLRKSKGQATSTSSTKSKSNARKTSLSMRTSMRNKLASFAAPGTQRPASPMVVDDEKELGEEEEEEEEEEDELQDESMGAADQDDEDGETGLSSRSSPAPKANTSVFKSPSRIETDIDVANLTSQAGEEDEEIEDDPLSVLSQARLTNSTTPSTISAKDRVLHPEIIRTEKVGGDLALRFDIKRVKAEWATRSGRCSSTRKATVQPELTESVVPLDAGVSNVEDNGKATDALARVIDKDDFAKMEVIGQFNLGFIVARRRHGSSLQGQENSSTMDDLFIVDQHASDEKYNFETLQLTTKIESQALLRPRPLELTAADEMLAIENINVFRQNGFEINVAAEGDGSVAQGHRLSLTAQPVSHNTVFNMKDLEELIHLMRDRPSGEMVRCSKARAMFAMRACRKSVMVGMPLTKQQMTTVIRHMGTIEQPWNCPHGRPTMRHLVDIKALGAKPRSDIDWTEFAMTLI